MNNKILNRTLIEKAQQLSEAGNHMGVLKMLTNDEQETVRACAECKKYIKTSYVIEYFQNCSQHGFEDGFDELGYEDEVDYEPDWDSIAKDEEIMKDEF